MKKRDNKNKVRAPEIEPASSENIIDSGDNAPQNIGITVEEEGEVPEITEQPVSLDALFTEEPEKEERKVLSDLEQIDPDLLTGEESAVRKKTPKAKKVKESKKNDVAPIKLDISGKSSASKASAAAVETPGKKRKGMTFVIIAIIAVLGVIAVSLFYEAGIKEKLQSPLIINGTPVDSAEFSFMYHYILIDNGVDIFASDTPAMLASPSADPNFPTQRDYFLNLTASEMQTTQILYDDAKAHGYDISEEHYTLARAYVDWLAGKAAELNVPLDTYIRGVFGNQVSEQVVLNTLAKKYFTEDYASGAKLEELQATEDQANAAYNDNMNAYDVVSYKILRMTYEQRDEAFVSTANRHAEQIIEGIGHDPAAFETVAAEYFSGEAADRLAQPDSTLVSDARYSDFTHTDFRDWLFDAERTPGDATIFTDNDGFPIILCFVSRDRQSVPLRDVRIVQVNVADAENANGLSVSEAQSLAQEIYDQIETEGDMQSVENIYNDAILSGNIEVTHSSDTYPGKYDGILDEWIFASERVAGDRAFLETESGYYIVYMVSISENPEWYDRVNSFIRMRNYQAFLAEMESEYSYEFVQSGLDAIQDVP
ncbi:hypothetical protein SAMN05216413_0792 [Ruminococcaceae bacterium KH2T8]|nr:hypothetical protein SAMN05216413_0792 [Ruminococcaceae bacterium KH2T8]